MAIEPVVVNFRIGGIGDVQKAFRTVQQALEQLETGKTRAAKKGAGERSAIQKTEADRMLRTVDGAQKVTDKVERDKVRAVEAGARQRMRIIENSANMAGRLAKQQADEEIRQAQRVWQARERFARSIGRGVMNGGRVVGGIAAGVMRTALTVGGGFSVADAAERTASRQRDNALLANSAYIPGRRMAAGFGLASNPERADPAKIDARIRAVEAATGVDASELSKGTRAYVARSSDFTGGMENMEFFAKIAKGTGTSFEDVTKAAGNLRSQNKDLSGPQMKQMLLDVVQQGKSGSVELDDLSRAAGKITKTSSMYGMSQTDAQRQLLGLSQISARTSGGSVDEAATELSMFGADTLKHGKKMAGLGIKTADKHGDLLDPETIITNILRQTKGNIGKIQELGYGQRSLKFFEALTPTFKGAGGGEAGIKAVLDDMRNVTGAKYDEGKLGEDFKNVVSSPAEQLGMALQQLREKVGDAVVPELVKMIPVLQEMTPALVTIISKGVPAIAELVRSLADFVSKNQWLIDTIAAHPIGAIMAVEVTKSIGLANIGAVIKGLLTGSGGGVPGAAGSAGGMGPVGLGLAVGAVGAGVAANSLLKYSGGEDLAMSYEAKVRARMRGDDYGTGMTAADAQKKIDEAQKRLDKGSVLGHVADLATSPFVDASSRDYAQYKSDQALVDDVKLRKAIADAVVGGMKDGLGRSPPIADPNLPTRGAGTVAPTTGGP